MKKIAIAVVVPLGMLVGLLIPSPADAAPTGCSWNYSGRTQIVSTCTGGTGEHRAVASCDGYTLSNQYVFYTAYGSWQRPGRASVADCSRTLLLGERAYFGLVEVR
jgi:hypothetical protein